MSKLPIALGLYSVRDTLFSDTEGTFKKVREMGYEGVEFFGPFSILPQKLRDLSQKYSLPICGWHVGLEALEGANYDATVAYLKAVGVTTIAVPWLDADSAQGWNALGQRMNAAAIRLKEHGIKLGYHNHAHEFANSYGGKTAWDIFFDAMSNEVFPQIDTGNALQGGANLASEFAQFKGRLQTIHFKPFKKGAGHEGFDVLFGADDHDLPALVAAAEAGGAGWHVIEYECPDTYSQFGGAREALISFKKALGK